MSISDGFTVTGNASSTAVENREHNAILMCKRTVAIPDDCKYRFDYDGRTDGQPVYAGYVERGVSEDADGTADYQWKSWLLYKYEYDGSNFLSSKKTAYDSWTNRAGATYE